MLQDTKAKLNLAMQLLSQQKYSEGGQVFRELIADGTEVAESLYGLGLIQLNTGDLQSAQMQFQNCLKLQPNHSNAYFYLGHISEARNEIQESQRLYSKALEVNPEHAGAKRKLRSPAASSTRVAVDGQETPRGADRNDLYALFRRSSEPVEQEIAGHLDAIANRIGTRSARFRAFLGRALGIWILLLVPTAFGLVAIPQIRGRLGNVEGLLLLTFAFVAILAATAIALQARCTKIHCDRDWLLITQGVFSKATTNVHLYILSKEPVLTSQTFINRITNDGTLQFPTMKMRGFFNRDELRFLSEHFRQLSLLNPTSRAILSAIGELRNIRSGPG